MIQLQAVEKVYRTDTIETVALAGVNLEIAEGEFISIMGPSGCGKSTLLNLIGLLDAPTKGHLALDNTPINGAGDRKLRVLTKTTPEATRETIEKVKKTPQNGARVVAIAASAAEMATW